MPMGTTEGEQGMKRMRHTSLGDQSRCDGKEMRAKMRMEDVFEG